MPTDAKLVLLFAGLHLLGLVMVAVLLIVFMRSDTASAWSPPDESEGGGGNDRLRPRRPGGPRDGGLPLPDAAPARMRLREHLRLADLLPRPARRPVEDPGRKRTPRRTPTR